MARFVAFLRGVSPLTLKMPELKRCLEQEGFGNVRTLLSSGNVAFDSARKTEHQLEIAVEAAMESQLGRAFYTIVRSQDELQALLATDPFSKHDVPPGAKRVVSFLRDEQGPLVPLPLQLAGASVLEVKGKEAFTVYEQSPEGPVFMKLIERAFGKNVTTRTWDTVRKCSVA